MSVKSARKVARGLRARKVVGQRKDRCNDFTLRMIPMFIYESSESGDIYRQSRISMAETGIWKVDREK